MEVEVGERKRRRGGESEYVYLPIADAVKAAGAKVCLFAAVSEIGAAVRSRGSDFSLTLKIVDQSCTATGISVTFFADHTGILPHVRSSGDVISLHNVMIKMHDGDFFCVHDKRFSSFALFGGKFSTECSPYQTSKKHHGSEHDKELLSQMRTWLVYHPPGLKDFDLQLRSIKAETVFDLICKVLHVHEAAKGEWIIYVWDGTDAPLTEFQTDLDTEVASPPPLHLEQTPLPREVLCALPCVGTVLRVFSYRFWKEIAHLQGGAYWVRLCNITCKQDSGMWKGVLQPSSRVRLLSNDDGKVVDRLSMYNKRIKIRVQRQPTASLPSPSDVADVAYGQAGYSTLMESLTHGQVTHKFKSLVRVVAAYPWHPDHLRSPVTGNYCVRLTLEDPTARIHAYVHKEDGVKFFGGYPSTEILASKMNKLLGIPDDAKREGAMPTRKPPWIWCCLKSYRLDKSDPWGSRRYRIFATKIKD